MPHSGMGPWGPQSRGIDQLGALDQKGNLDQQGDHRLAGPGALEKKSDKPYEESDITGGPIVYLAHKPNVVTASPKVKVLTRRLFS